MSITQFTALVGRAQQPSEVCAMLERLAARRGFEVFAIGAPHRNGAFAGYFYTTWPQSWLDTYQREQLARHDPIPDAARVNVLPFTWKELAAGRNGLTMTPENLRAFAIGGAAGYRDGLVVPLHGPGGYLVLASYAGYAPDLSPPAQAELHLATLHAHVRLAALHAEHGHREAGTGAPAALTARETEALTCVLSGLTDAVAARRMGVSERTARFHIANARRKLGAQTRAQAVAAALAQGLLAP